MLTDFQAAEIQTGETSIFVRHSGSGSPVLLLHGFPETHLMWRDIAPVLARHFTVACANLRGDSGQTTCAVTIDAGHFFPEEKPERTVELLREFLTAD
jgi:haloacetate dehalogenase